MRRRVFGVAVLAMATALAVAGIAVGEKAQIGNLILEVDGNVKPNKLPKKKMAPVALKVNGKVTTDDSSVPPVLNRIVIDFDKDGTVNTKGLSSCNPNKIRNSSSKQAKSKCKKALVGEGTGTATVKLTGQDPIDAEGPLLAFNGPKKGGKPTIIFHLFAAVPLPTPFVTVAPISSAPGKKFGKRVTIDVPPIAGGNGTLTGFDITVKKNWKIKKKGKKKAKKMSYITAKCSDRKFIATAHVEWNDSRELDINVQRPCKVKK